MFQRFFKFFLARFQVFNSFNDQFGFWNFIKRMYDPRLGDRAILFQVVEKTRQGKLGTQFSLTDGNMDRDSGALGTRLRPLIVRRHCSIRTGHIENTMERNQIYRNSKEHGKDQLQMNLQTTPQERHDNHQTIGESQDQGGFFMGKTDPQQSMVYMVGIRGERLFPWRILMAKTRKRSNKG